MTKPSKLTFVGGKPVLVPYDQVERSDNDQAYNQARDANQTKYIKFYHSALWTHKREAIKQRDLELCQRCGMELELVDHIVPSKDDWEDRLNDDNLQGLCNACHRLKTKREWIKHHKGANRYMTITVVCGLPSSGKTTYVRKHQTKHDLIYDYDSLMQSLTGLPSHSKNFDVHDYIILFFEQMLRKLKSEQTFDNVWIIQTYPDERIDSLLSPYHHVNHILIDVDKQTCIDRLNNDKRLNSSLISVFNEFETKKFTNFKRVTE